MRGEIPVRALRGRGAAGRRLLLVNLRQNPFRDGQRVASVLAGDLWLLAGPDADHEVVLFVQNRVPFFQGQIFHQEQAREQPFLQLPAIVRRQLLDVDLPSLDAFTGTNDLRAAGGEIDAGVALLAIDLQRALRLIAGP